MTFTLDQVVPWGRTRDEYEGMFALSNTDLRRKILGCGDGPASFNAEMTAAGHSVISCDPVYAFSGIQIEQRVRETYESIVSQVKREPHNYRWTRFKDPDDLGRHRLSAMQAFLADYEQGKAQGRYVLELLPALGFTDGQFDLALCSHLLFLYSEQLSEAFHIASVRELCRVADEVRIFPLLALDCKPSRHLESVRDALTRDGWTVEMPRVNYEFQVGGDQMMRVYRA